LGGIRLNGKSRFASGVTDKKSKKKEQKQRQPQVLRLRWEQKPFPTQLRMTAFE
jgi:hypothetical protein